jgi:hypothetical protein
MLFGEHDPNPPCLNDTATFYGTEDDGRQEAERDIRESEAKALCYTCPYRWRCLEYAIIHGERYGVWGGMGEAERKRFMEHLKDEGYTRRDMPGRGELIAAVRAFYRKERREIALAKTRAS